MTFFNTSIIFLKIYIYGADANAAVVLAVKQHAQKLPEDVSLWSTVLRGWNRKKKKEHCDESDYLPPIPHKFNEDNQGFVSWCHANLLTGGTETELDPQVQAVPTPPSFLSVSSVFVACFFGGVGGGGGSSVFIFSCLVCRSFKSRAKNSNSVSEADHHTQHRLYYWGQFPPALLKATAKLSRSKLLLMRLPQRVCGNRFSQKVRI